MENQKDLYEVSADHMKKMPKVNLNGWPKCTHLKKDQKLLEVGCGRGMHFKYYLKKSKNIYGMDISKKMVDENPLRDVVQLAQGNIESKTKYKDNTFDVIVMVDVIEHIINRYKVLRELKRILKKGGKLVIITPNLAKARNRLRLLFGAYPHTADKVVKPGVDFFDGGHLQYFTFPTLRQAGEREGLKFEKEYGFGRFGKVHDICRGLMSGSICMIFKKV
jgi:ubiquinone/menaquinone biosynthesis C-methylase UbiE